jgi:hypothetical protein
VETVKSKYDRGLDRHRTGFELDRISRASSELEKLVVTA